MLLKRTLFERYMLNLSVLKYLFNSISTIWMIKIVAPGSIRRLITGDLIFLASNLPHALRNNVKGSCMYFAFQFE